MAQFTFGPVELYLVGLEGDRPSAGVLEALGNLLDTEVVRLLDFMIITKDTDGEVTVTEIEYESEDYGFGGADMAAVGIAGDDDIEQLAELVPPGSSAALVVLELTWAKKLSERFAASGAEVLSVERIPAPVVNGLVDAVSSMNEN
ncbi:DUF6325 family protein [Paeniglutamicibacter cryotolerans]|uniref:Putative membrane protein n=1 Tax=Paeniglutamicibacter cryotolerans TaxID=670079 RepID=A0A839QL31_9MICC|nr:DUF6325 family protein [Paeniglutamicibacter cryotolerans]MBB2995474.1 putative membrane protein [Paeniglutamicibacter cryotolerans]